MSEAREKAMSTAKRGGSSPVAAAAHESAGEPYATLSGPGTTQELAVAVDRSPRVRRVGELQSWLTPRSTSLQAVLQAHGATAQRKDVEDKDFIEVLRQQFGDLGLDVWGSDNSWFVAFSEEEDRDWDHLHIHSKWEGEVKGKKQKVVKGTEKWRISVTFTYNAEGDKQHAQVPLGEDGKLGAPKEALSEKDGETFNSLKEFFEAAYRAALEE